MIDISIATEDDDVGFIPSEEFHFLPACRRPLFTKDVIDFHMAKIGKSALECTPGTFGTFGLIVAIPLQKKMTNFLSELYLNE